MSCPWPQPSTSFKPWEVRTDGCAVSTGAIGKSGKVDNIYIKALQFFIWHADIIRLRASSSFPFWGSLNSNESSINSTWRSCWNDLCYRLCATAVSWKGSLHWGQRCFSHTWCVKRPTVWFPNVAARWCEISGWQNICTQPLPSQDFCEWQLDKGLLPEPCPQALQIAHLLFHSAVFNVQVFAQDLHLTLASTRHQVGSQLEKKSVGYARSGRRMILV